MESPAFTQSPDAAACYGVALPPALASLRHRGVSGSARDEVFLPLWTGISHDAGGLIWAPRGSPAGYDRYGMIRRQPVQLESEWWARGV